MPFLRRALESIANQTFKGWIVVAWDRGSSDGSAEELSRWIPERLPGKVILNPAVSLGSSLGQMVELAETEFCARMEADHFSRNDRLEQQISFLKQRREIAFLGSQVERTNLWQESYAPLIPPLLHEDIIHALLFSEAIPYASALFRREAVLKVGNYRSHSLPGLADYELLLRIAAKYRLANLTAPLVITVPENKSARHMAMVDGEWLRRIDEIFCQNALALYGCEPTEAQLLRRRNHPKPFRAMFHIAKHLKKEQGGTLRGRFFSSSFLESLQNFVPRSGFSHAVLAVLRRRHKALGWLLSKAVEKMAKRAPFTRLTSRFLKWAEAQKRRRSTAAWLRKLEEVETEVHPSVEFTGHPSAISFVEVGSHCHFERDLTLWIAREVDADPRLRIGEGVYIGRNTFVGVFQEVEIGRATQIGAYTYIISGNHRFTSREIPIAAQGFEGKAIHIGEEVWLGAHVIVLPGVTIGKGSIVAAGSVVTSDIPAYEIWAGVPAKFLRMRPNETTAMNP